MSVKATNFVRRLRGLSPDEKAVAFVLADHDDHKGRGTWPSMSTVAQEAGLAHRQTASDITKRLTEHWKIIFSLNPSKGGKPSVYQFNYDLVNRNPRVAVDRNYPIAVQLPPTATQVGSNRNPEPEESASTATQEASNRNPRVAGRGTTKGKERKGEAEEEGDAPVGSPAAAAPHAPSKRKYDYKRSVQFWNATSSTDGYAYLKKNGVPSPARLTDQQFQTAMAYFEKASQLTISPDRIKYAFDFLQAEPYGPEPFRLIWTEEFERAWDTHSASNGELPRFADAMERTITRTQTLNLKVPPAFFLAKRNEEKTEADFRSRLVQ